MISFPLVKGEMDYLLRNAVGLVWAPWSQRRRGDFGAVLAACLLHVASTCLKARVLSLSGALYVGIVF